MPFLMPNQAEQVCKDKKNNNGQFRMLLSINFKTSEEKDLIFSLLLNLLTAADCR